MGLGLGVLGKAIGGKAGKGLQFGAAGAEATVGIIRGGQAVGSILDGNGRQAAGELGEATLRLFSLLSGRSLEDLKKLVAKQPPKGSGNSEVPNLKIEGYVEIPRTFKHMEIKKNWRKGWREAVGISVLE